MILRRAADRRIVLVCALAVASLALLFSLATYTFSDDHFGRISPGRQIARYGELPFRDFFDPGYFLTDMASAAVQRVLGDNLLGEMLLTSSFVAGGAVAILFLVVRATSSPALACLTAVVAVLTFRRPYDYDKFLFYPLGLLASWRYAASLRSRDLVAAAVVTAIAGLFRYDNALFVAAGAITVIVALHLRESTHLAQRVGLFLAVCVVCVAPYVLFLMASGAAGAAVDQMTRYAQREGARTRILALPRGALPDIHVTRSPPAQPQDSWRRRLRRNVPLIGRTSASWSAEGAAAASYYLFVVLVATATVVAVRAGGTDQRQERAQVLSAVTVSLLGILVILREPIIARIGGMIGPPAALAAWVWYRSAHLFRGPSGGSRRAIARLWQVVRVTIAACVLVTLAVSTEWRSGLSLVRRNGNVLTRLDAATATPPAITMLPKPRLIGLVEYLRRCTQPEDRLFAAWFVPELYFFSGRAFAGGMVATFGDHWSEPAYQRRIVEKLRTESVPLVLAREGDESFSRGYPIVIDYLRANYREAGSSAFGATDGGRYTVFTQIDRAATGIDATTSMPCFTSRA